ncbi:MAG: GNAT family N-acetyltransferase [Pseudomonadota bacterium]
MKRIITTERLILRPPKMEDLDDMFAAANNIEIAKWLARMPWPLAIEDTKRFIEQNADGQKMMRVVYFEDCPIGVVNADGGFGFWIAQPFWGRGFATEAGQAMIDQAFQTTSIAAMPTGYFVGNTASARVLDKLGFVNTDVTELETVAFGVKTSRNMILTRETWKART